MITKVIFICKSSEYVFGITKKVFFFFFLSCLWIFPINYKNVIHILKVNILHITDTVKENVIFLNICN